MVGAYRLPDPANGEQRYEDDGGLRSPNEIDEPPITLGGTVDAAFPQVLSDATGDGPPSAGQAQRARRACTGWLRASGARCSAATPSFPRLGPVWDWLPPDGDTPGSGQQ